MPGPNRINFLSLFCSCVGHAAILGGIMYGLTDFHRERIGLKQSSRTLVMELIPLDRTNDAHDTASAFNRAEPLALVARMDQGAFPKKIAPPREAIELVSKPGDTAEAARASVAERENAPVIGAEFSDYQRRLYDALARGSRYPAEARRMHLAGVTQLAFKVDRSGTVLESWIKESSGSELLDNAALEALARAQPLPPIPAGLPARMDFVIEIDLSVMQQSAMQTVG